MNYKGGMHFEKENINGIARGNIVFYRLWITGEFE